MTMTVTSGVYWIYRKPGHVYVGSAVDIGRRWRDHRRQLDTGKHENPRLRNAWNKHGSAAFQWAILETVPREEGEGTQVYRARLLGVEQWFIDATGAAAGSGYNVCKTAGSTLGLRHSAETRTQISAAKKGKPSPLKGKPNLALKGKPNLALKGKPNPLKGKPRPDIAERNRANRLLAQAA